MWRQALLIAVAVFFSLTPARSFAFEGTLEGKISWASRGRGNVRAAAAPILSFHALSSTEGIPDQGNEGPKIFKHHSVPNRQANFQSPTRSARGRNND